MTGWTTRRMDGKEDRRHRPPQQDKTKDIIYRDEWVNPFTHVNERGWVSDCVSWVCLCHISDNLLVNRILDGQMDGHTRFSAETLNPKPGHTQEDTLTVRDTHYTEWYPYPEFSEPTQEFTHYTEVLANRIWLGKDRCLAKFQHFILRCIKISLLYGYHWKRG